MSQPLSSAGSNSGVWAVPRAGQQAGTISSLNKGVFFSFDADVGAMYLHLRDEEVSQSVSAEGEIVVDISPLGKLIGVELILNGAESIEKFSKLLSPDRDESQMTSLKHLGDDDKTS